MWRSTRARTPGYQRDLTGRSAGARPRAVALVLVDQGALSLDSTIGEVLLGHSGNFAGYTTLMIATPNGRRSAVVTVNEQLAEDAKPETFEHLRPVFELAACAALPR